MEKEVLLKIAGLLKHKRVAKEAVIKANSEILRFCVEEMKMDRIEATKIDLSVFLDGFLVAHKMQQEFRNIEVT